MEDNFEENNILTVQSENGDKINIEIYDIFEWAEKNKKYVVYSVENNPNNDIFVSILNETEDSFSLDSIDDENEYQEIEKYLEEKLEEIGE